MTGNLTLAPLLLVAIIFMWTPPHFWALSLWRSDDYARAGVPMLPVVRGKPHTRFQILLYTLVLVPLGVTPAAAGASAAPSILAASAGIGLWFLWEAIATYRERDEAKEPAAHRLFGVSLFYMTALFSALILEKADRAAGLVAFHGVRIVRDDADRASRERRKRNIALALVLGAFAVLVYLMSLVQWHGGH